MQNYIDLGKTLLGGWENYVYLDTEDLLAANLIRRCGIHVRLMQVMARENEKYRLVAVKVLKKDEIKFRQVMEDLKGMMLLYGNRDYESRGGQLMEITMGIIRREAARTGRIQLPMGGTLRAGAVT